MIAVIFILLTILALHIVVMTLFNGISPMPTSRKVKKVFLSTLPQLKEGQIIELGAGWGSLSFELAVRYPQCRVVAYENSWIPYLVCRCRQRLKNQPNLLFIYQNFYHSSLKDASLVVCYLFPGAMKKLKSKFSSELSGEAIIATHTFLIPGWRPFFSQQVADLYTTSICHYKKQ